VKQILKREISKLKNKAHVDQKVLQKFLQRLKHKSLGLLKHESLHDHFCTFFLPVHLKSKSVYLGHHIKADDWIPPGGHIEPDEHPLDTIKREFLEELKHELMDEKIELFDIGIKLIDNPLHNCKAHWDLWYLVHTDKINFRFTKKEYYHASWFKLEKAVTLTQDKDQSIIMQKLLLGKI